MTPKEVINVSEISDIRSGYSLTDSQGGTRHALAMTLVVGNRSIEYEAFTPEDREVWINMFRALLSFMRKQ